MRDQQDSPTRDLERELIDGAEPTVMVRQGDVLLVRLEHLPADAVETPTSDRKIVLARSGTTGHAHQLFGGSLRQFAAHDTTIVEVTGCAVLTHDEHDPLDLPPGTWEIRLQRQYDATRLRPTLALY
jgi:hypothetical protein